MFSNAIDGQSQNRSRRSCHGSPGRIAGGFDAEWTSKREGAKSKALSDLQGSIIIAGAENENRKGLVCVAFEGKDSADITAQLSKQGIPRAHPQSRPLFRQRVRTLSGWKAASEFHFATTIARRRSDEVFASHGRDCLVVRSPYTRFIFVLYFLLLALSFPPQRESIVKATSYTVLVSYLLQFGDKIDTYYLEKWIPAVAGMTRQLV